MFNRLLAPALLAGCAIFAPFAAAHAAQAGASSSDNEIRVEVSGVRSARGHVRVDICSRREFLSPCRFGGEAPAHVGVTVVTIRGLPPGDYAAQGFQDENDNHEVDRNVIGVPTEGVGFSNNAPISFHAPSFQRASFTYVGGEQTIAFKLRYFLR